MVGPNWDRKIHDCDGPTRDVFSSGRSESHLKMKKKCQIIYNIWRPAASIYRFFTANSGIESHPKIPRNSC